MTPSPSASVRSRPLVAASGAVAALVVLAAVVGLAGVFGPGGTTDVVVGTSLVGLLAGIALLVVLVAARVARGWLAYVEKGATPSGADLVLAALETFLAAACVAVVAVAALLASGSDPNLAGAIGGGALLLVAPVGFALAVVSLVRAGLTLLGPPS